jgi:hypothetical protein
MYTALLHISFPSLSSVSPFITLFLFIASGSSLTTHIRHIFCRRPTSGMNVPSQRSPLSKVQNKIIQQKTIYKQTDYFLLDSCFPSLYSS